MFTIGDARRYAVQCFLQSPLLGAQRRTHVLDADVLLQHVLHKPRSWLFAHAGDDISSVKDIFLQAVEKRCSGLPAAYITGEKEFFGLPFYVTPDVLIPKPDTELLVERAVAVLKEKLQYTAEPVRLLDPCTGSGCIAVSVVHTLFTEVQAPIVCAAADISLKALNVAQKNAVRLLPFAKLSTLYQDSGRLPGVHVQTLHTDAPHLILYQADMRTADSVRILPAAYRSFDLITANPPYVPSALTAELLQDGRREPALALDGGADGLDFIRILANTISLLLNDGGVLLCEAGEYHIEQAAAYFREAGLTGIRIHYDLAQQPRLIEGVWYDSKN